MNTFQAIVVGSGPAGVMCASKLVENEISTLMIDYGVDLEDDKYELTNQLKSLDTEEWNTNIRRRISGYKKNYDEIYQKLLFGSDFAYRSANEKLDLELKDIDYKQSLAKGGLSNVWGGAILPYTEDDLKNWPINVTDLEPYYAYVVKKIGMTANIDDFDQLFPKYTSKYTSLNSSKQIKYLKELHNQNKKKLRKMGFVFGNSRLAINEEKKKCIYCAACIYGCVHSLIFNSKNYLEELINNNLFTYKSNLLAKQFIENKDEIRIICETNNKEEIIYKANRLYIGAGFISSTKLVLNSIIDKEQNLKVLAKDSQHFILPAISFKNIKNPKEESVYTLSQYFIGIKKNKIFNNKYTHLQIYSYNDIIGNYFENKFGFFFKFFSKLISKLLIGRIIIIQGFLHSDLSSKAEFKLIKGKKKFILYGNQIKNSEINTNINKIISMLINNSVLLGFFPIKFLMKVGNFGRSFHSGSTFVMTKNNNKIGESDVWGRPCGFKRAHLIDSSVFPDIPSNTISLTVMANSVRIANQYKNFE